MAKLDICTALVHINEHTAVFRGPNNPLNYAEIELLRYTLGERAITDEMVIRTEETTNQEVLDLLRETYTSEKVAEAFPGTRPRLPMEAPVDTPRLSDGIPDEAPKHVARKKAKAAERLPTLSDAHEEAFDALTGD